MMKDALIRLKGTQGADGNEETVELTTVGRFGLRGDAVLLTYDEGEMLGVKGVKTTLRYQPPGRVILQRTGALESKMEIRRGEYTDCLYATPYGKTLLGIFGEQMEARINEEGGDLLLRYTLTSNGTLLSKNTVEIHLKEVK